VRDYFICRACEGNTDIPINNVDIGYTLDILLLLPQVSLPLPRLLLPNRFYKIQFLFIFVLTQQPNAQLQNQH
jgi:hypothetical protein